MRRPRSLACRARHASCVLACPRRYASGDLSELLGFSQLLQLLQALVLDLADALAGDVEGPPHLVERARVLAAEAVAQLQNAALAVGEVLQRFLQRLFGQQVRCPVEGGLGLLVGDEL